jgi:hypothetical protein
MHPDAPSRPGAPRAPRSAPPSPSAPWRRSLATARRGPPTRPRTARRRRVATEGVHGLARGLLEAGDRTLHGPAASGPMAPGETGPGEQGDGGLLRLAAQLLAVAFDLPTPACTATTGRFAHPPKGPAAGASASGHSIRGTPRGAQQESRNPAQWLPTGTRRAKGDVLGLSG